MTRRAGTTAWFKAKVALAAIKGEQTVVELPQQFDVHANRSNNGKTSDGATDVFGDKAKAEPAVPTVDVKTHHAKIGELKLGNDFLSGALGKLSGESDILTLQKQDTSTLRLQGMWQLFKDETK